MAQAKKRKRFFDVDIPLIKRDAQLYAYEPSEIVGKTIKYDMTRLLKGKNAIIYLSVKKENGEFTAAPKKIEIIHSSLGRAVRRGTDYIEDSFVVNCKDAEIRIKPFLVSRRKVHKSVRKALRNKAKEEITAYAKEKTAYDIFDDLIKNQLQKPLSLKLKKVYPLSAFEIRVLEIVKPLSA